MVNLVILVGRLGMDPRMSYTPNKTPICDLKLATTERWRDKSGKKQERTEWHAVEVFGPQAESCYRHLGKGRMVYVEGRIKTTKYVKDDIPRYFTKVVANLVRFLDHATEPSDETKAPRDSSIADYRAGQEEPESDF
jgi:single-strand DNA-binding protein